MMAVGIASVFAGDIATVHAASVPVLVKDINTRIKNNSNIRNMTAAGNVLFFTAYDLAHGNELWKSDGTSAGTAMVKDIKPGTGDSYHNPDYLTFWNGYVYFEAYGPNGWSLWKSDGTSANTAEVSQDVDPEHIVIFKGALYFSGYNDGLWKSDGTTAGTVAVSPGIGTLDNLVVVGANRLYFTKSNDLWTSDGTTSTLLKSGVYPDQLTSVNGTLYFYGWDSTNGYRLWTSDGTPSGTVALSYAATPHNLTDVNGTLFFAASDPTYGASLIKLVAGVPIVVKSGITPSNLYNWNGVLYFANANGLWKSDGTLGGTVVVKASVWPSLMTGIGGLLYFNGWDSAHGYELWSSDGSPTGTTARVKDIYPGTTDSDPSQLTNVNGTLFLTATEPTTGTQLWKSNGTDAGTVLVQNISPGTQDSSPDKFLDVNGTLYFAADDYTNGDKLWQTNGTAAATSMVPGFTGVNPVPLVNAAGTLYFAANADDLWKRVGSSDALLVKAGVTSNDPSKAIYINGTLYFVGWDSTHGYELWKSDGTTAGTGMVKDIYTGTSQSSIDKLINLNGTLYFVATNATGRLLWTSDGTDAGTVPVRGDINSVSELTLVNGKLFFSGDDASNHDALWVSDGTSGGTTVLMNNVYPSKLTVVGSNLFFQGWTSPTGYELWKSNGTVAGTGLVKDIHSGSSNPDNLTNVNGTLYFTVWNTWDIPSHDQIWKSDGTTAGTVVVKDLPSDYGFTSINSLTSVHGILAFVFMNKSYYPSTDDSAELWISDGTSAGTVMVKDIYPGDYGSAPASLTMANSPSKLLQNEALFFSAIDPTAGRELFILDFTPPVSSITLPADNAYIRGTNFTITGTSSDSIPGTGVNLVEVSTDGATWHSATDTSGNGTWATWQYTWTLPVDGVYAIRNRATDLATNVQTPLASISVTVDNTLPVVTFSMPAVYHSLTVPLTFSATDNLSGIDRYCLTTTNSSASCPWTLVTPPSSYLFSSEGNNTLYAWAKDRAGNISLIKNSTTLVSLPHTLNIDLANDGRGSGSVYFQQKNATYNVDTAVTVYSYDPITLQATHSEYSLFWSWSGICTGAGDCNYTVPTVAVSDTITATATFAFDSDHAVLVAPHYFTTILGAYQADTTVNGDEIRIFGTSFSETLLFDKGKNVTLTGGDNQAHTSNSGGMTTVQGTMTIKSGSVTVDKITIRQ
jgi:ELWxxDGT repeat protein